MTRAMTTIVAIYGVCAAVFIAHTAQAASVPSSFGTLDTFEISERPDPALGGAYSYAIAVDAGSSGSRLSLYRWYRSWHL